MMASAADVIPPIPAHVDPALVVDVDIYALPGQPQDFHRAWKMLQDGAPDLVWTPRNEGHWIALRGPVLNAVQSDHERFSSQVIVLPKSIGAQHALIPTTIDPPAHRPYRKLLNEGMSLARMRRMHPAITDTAGRLIDGFFAQGRCDFTADYAQVLPIEIFMALVGIPMADAAQIRLWAESMTRPNPPMPFDAARAAFFAYLEPIIAQRRQSPGDDLISHIVTADISEDGETGAGRLLEEAEALSLATQVLIAGVDTVVNILGFIMLELARNAPLRASLRQSEPRAVLSATHELFRRFGLVTIARMVRHDIVFCGQTLKAGDMVCIPTQIHGLDERINPASLKIDLNRKDARHSAFGSGAHMCPGQELARAEVAITITEWLRRIPDFRVGATSDLTCGGGIVGNIARLCLEWDV